MAARRQVKYALPVYPLKSCLCILTELQFGFVISHFAGYNRLYRMYFYCDAVLSLVWFIQKSYNRMPIVMNVYEVQKSTPQKYEAIIERAPPMMTSIAILLSGKHGRHRFKYYTTIRQNVNTFSPGA